jgi:hypothetical protein
MLQTARPGRLATIAAALLAALASCTVLPIPAAAQAVARRPSSPSPVVVEQYLSRSRMNPTVLGTRARLTGAGARVLYPAARHGYDAAPGWRDGLALGGFLAYAPAGAEGFSTSHYGVAAELPLRRAPLGGRIEPRASRGVGAFRIRHSGGASSPAAVCVRPLDLAGGAGARHCVTNAAAHLSTAVAGTAPAISPGLALRVGLVPRVALRTDLRDVVVYRGGRPSHNLEMAAGLSFAR